MRTEQASQLLGDVRTIRRSTRELLRSWWFPPLVFGLLMLGSAPLCLIHSSRVPTRAFDWYWLGAGATGVVLTWVRHRRQLSRQGVMGPLWGEILSALVLWAVAFLAGRSLFGGPPESLLGLELPSLLALPVVDIIEFGPWLPGLALVAGYGVLAVLHRRWGLGLAGLAAGAWLAVAGTVGRTVAWHTAELVETGPAIPFGTFEFYVIGGPVSLCLVPVIAYAVAFIGLALASRFLLVRAR